MTGRAQFGNDRLDLAALVAHGERDGERLFIEPVVWRFARERPGDDDSDQRGGAS